MDIFERFEAFPEIHNIAFIPLNKNEPPPDQLIHAGSKGVCPDTASFTKEQKSYLEKLVIDLGYYGNSKNLKFVTVNELKEQQERFCQKCLPFIAYFHNAAYTEDLKCFLKSSETVKLFLDEKISLNYIFLSKLLQADDAYCTFLGDVYGQGDILILEIREYFKNQLDTKIKEVILFLKQEKSFTKMKNFAFQTATKAVLNENILDSSLNAWLSPKLKELEEVIKNSSSYVLYEESYDDFSFLKNALNSALKAKTISRKEASFLIQLLLTYTYEDSSFVSMPYGFFLARNKIMNKLNLRNVMENKFIIIDNEPGSKVLETCKSLFDEDNLTFNSYEKVYEIALNL